AGVGERGPQALHQLCLTRGTRRGARERRMVDVVLSEQIVQQRQVAIVEGLPEPLHGPLVGVVHPPTLAGRTTTPQDPPPSPIGAGGPRGQAWSSVPWNSNLVPTAFCRNDPGKRVASAWVAFQPVQ